MPTCDLVNNIELFEIIDGSVIYQDRAEEWIGIDISLKKQYDPVNTAFVRNRLKQGDTFIDVGAYVGYFTILASRVVGSSGKVYAFEPCRYNYDVLLKNIEKNNLTNVVAVNKAAYNSNSLAGIYVYGRRHRALSSLCPERNRFYTPNVASDGCLEKVETIRLDEYFNSNSIKPDMIKIDVEGAEPEVIEGLGDFVGKIPLMLLEDVVGNAIAKVRSRGYRVSGGCNAVNYVLEKL